MWICIANKFAKFHPKRLNQSENIPKRFRGLLFWNTLYSIFPPRLKLIRHVISLHKVEAQSNHSCNYHFIFISRVSSQQQDELLHSVSPYMLCLSTQEVKKNKKPNIIEEVTHITCWSKLVQGQLHSQTGCAAVTSERIEGCTTSTLVKLRHVERLYTRTFKAEIQRSRLRGQHIAVRVCHRCL